MPNRFYFPFVSYTDDGGGGVMSYLKRSVVSWVVKEEPVRGEGGRALAYCPVQILLWFEAFVCLTTGSVG